MLRVALNREARRNQKGYRHCVQVVLWSMEQERAARSGFSGGGGLKRVPTPHTTLFVNLLLRIWARYLPTPSTNEILSRLWRDHATLHTRRLDHQYARSVVVMPGMTRHKHNQCVSSTHTQYTICPRRIQKSRCCCSFCVCNLTGGGCFFARIVVRISNGSLGLSRLGQL
jgi:hypothetical protein